jgi:hypothetical protein
MKKILGIASVEQEGYYPFGKQTFYFEDMVRAADKMDLDLLFFSPIDWHIDRDEVDGYVYNEGKWIKIRAPFPKIVYDRSFSKAEEGKEKIEFFRRFLVQKHIPVLNPVGYADLLNDKIAFHRFLADRGLPTLETLPIEFMLSDEFAVHGKIRELYLKPIMGTGGFGIFVLKKQGTEFILDNHINTQRRQFSTARDAFDYLTGIIDVKSYFLQPAADMYYFEGSPFDIRVLVQNYGVGDYHVTGTGVRVGSKGGYVSNLNSGGTALPPEALAGYYYQHYQKNILAEMEQIASLCLSCCRELEREFGNFLEIGFDILLTKDKGPVILEGNSKPSRWIFNVLADYFSDNPEQFEKYRRLRAETVRVPLVYAEKNYPALEHEQHL